MTVASKTIVVETSKELMDAAGALSSGDTVLLKDNTYTISGFAIALRTDGAVIRSQSGNREKVIVSGAGFSGSVNHGFWISGDGVTIRDITIRNVSNHCIQTDVNTDRLRVINCVLKDGGEQLLKVPYSAGVQDPSEDGLVEGCRFEFTAGIAFQGYTGGVDCHYAKNWIIRNNTFKGIRSPESDPAEHAVHFWTNSEGTCVENNVIIDCDRGIGFGLGNAMHKGGVIRNNMIFHRDIGGNDRGDAGIILETSSDTKVYNNTVFFHHDYPNAIEYRFAATTNAYIANNLTNKLIRARDGATGTLAANVTAAQPGWFRSPENGDLHLSSGTIAEVADKGVSIQGLTHDIDGDGRPGGNGIDIGADEYAPPGAVMPALTLKPALWPDRRRITVFRAFGRSAPVTANGKCFDLRGRCGKGCLMAPALIAVPAGGE